LSRRARFRRSRVGHEPVPVWPSHARQRFPVEDLVLANDVVERENERRDAVDLIGGQGARMLVRHRATYVVPNARGIGPVSVHGRKRAVRGEVAHSAGERWIRVLAFPPYRKVWQRMPSIADAGAPPLNVAGSTRVGVREQVCESQQGVW